MAQEAVTILQFLAYLAIGLISVTIPTYAISITYLGRETEGTLKELERRRGRFSDKLDELRNRIQHETSTTAIQALKEEISLFEKEEERLKNRLFFLSAKGAVFFPVVFYIMSLGASLYGIVYATNEQVFPTLLGAAFSLFVGLALLWGTLHGVEEAALRPEDKLLPAFTVTFIDGTTTCSFPADTLQIFQILVRNNGEVMAKCVEALIAFPPDFEVPSVSQPEARLSTQPADRVIHGISTRGYDTLWVKLNEIHSTIMKSIPLSDVKIPARQGAYKIPVLIFSEQTKPSEHVLTIEAN
ncbi:MAG: hypothetical protein ABSA50_11910 [Candidatus Bathyarchaeia archaeon]